MWNPFKKKKENESWILQREVFVEKYIDYFEFEIKNEIFRGRIDKTKRIIYFTEEQGDKMVTCLCGMNGGSRYNLMFNHGEFEIKFK
ncbi:MAG TPA: hypothetical protein VNX68_12750 [Nitrosopumilaceae archaeon]|jgi:hypothetical protein|nr:hypothetical protein [Nitrosopumilaceae archaeon]